VLVGGAAREMALGKREVEMQFCRPKLCRRGQKDRGDQVTKLGRTAWVCCLAAVNRRSVSSFPWLGFVVRKMWREQELAVNGSAELTRGRKQRRAWKMTSSGSNRPMGLGLVILG
jgi:hypothetical protein